MQNLPLTKALQAAGRVIRPEKDRGLIVLMDSRFVQPVYSTSMPADWFDSDVKELVSDSCRKAEGRPFQAARSRLFLSEVHPGSPGRNLSRFLSVSSVRDLCRPYRLSSLHGPNVRDLCRPNLSSLRGTNNGARNTARSHHNTAYSKGAHRTDKAAPRSRGSGKDLVPLSQGRKAVQPPKN